MLPLVSELYNTHFPYLTVFIRPGNLEGISMTDWEKISEQIHQAMLSVEAAQQASEALQAEVNAKNLDNFTSELSMLEKNLTALNWVLEHTGQYSMDEVIEYLHELMSGKPAKYRTSIPIERAELQED